MKCIIMLWIVVLIHTVFGWWRPTPGKTWQWHLGGSEPINTGYAVQMYDLHLHRASNTTIAELKQRGIIVICSFSAGVYSPSRPDSGDFLLVHVAKGRMKFIDFRRSEILSIMKKRLDLAKRKGCDGVEPENVDAAFYKENGLNLTQSDQLFYNKWLADEAHHRNLSIGLANDVGQLKELEPYFDWALNTQCLQYTECDKYVNTFLSKNKAVFHVEYVDDLSDDYSAECNKTPPGFSTIIKDKELSGWKRTCTQEVRNLEVSSINTTVIQVKWEKPNWTYLVLTGYRVSLCTDGAVTCIPALTQEVNVVNVNATTTEVMLTNLEPHTRYVVRAVSLTSKDEDGVYGLASVVSYATRETAVAPPSIRPVNVNITDVTSRSFVVRWLPPSCSLWRSPFDSYTVVLRNTGSVVRKHEVTDANTHSYKMNNLHSNSLYNVSVCFSTNSTTSEPVTVLQETRLDRPDDQNLAENHLFIGLTCGLLLLIIGGLVGTCIYVRNKKPQNLEGVAFDDIDSDKKYDVFLCYKCGGGDEAFCVRQLLPKLEMWGFRVILHARDFIPGKEIAVNILEAVENTRRVILIISKDFLQSEWCRFEYQAAQHAMVGLQTRIIPVLLEDYENLEIEDRNLKHILDVVTYIRWDSKASVREDMWELLRSALPAEGQMKAHTTYA